MLTEYETAADDNVLRKLRQELERLQKYQNSHVLLVKRTANNRRIPCLAAAFPDAKYIFLVRDGRSVAASLTKVHWWNEHSVWWANRQTPLQMQAEGENMLGIAAKNWTEEMRCINEGLRHVMKKDVMMIRYEDILTNPHKCIHLILQHIGVNPLEVHDHAISNLELSDSMSWKKWNKEEMDRVLSIQTDFLRQYGYL
ncbi:MAG: sulfotransferase [Candidatus Thiodiazotropha sp.]